MQTIIMRLRQLRQQWNGKRLRLFAHKTTGLILSYRQPLANILQSMRQGPLSTGKQSAAISRNTSIHHPADKQAELHPSTQAWLATTHLAAALLPAWGCTALSCARCCCQVPACQARWLHRWMLLLPLLCRCSCCTLT